MFEIAKEKKVENQVRGTSSAKIKVIGVGGAGGNAVNTMIRAGLSGVEYIAVNTDMQALNANLATIKLQVGDEITKGLGAGANPEVGRKAALEAYEKLSEVINGADMVFITAGMGGGTGTGAAPVVAKLAMELGALTVGVVTRPFLFEGKKRIRQAEMGIKSLEDSVDSLITIPNQRLLYLAGEGLSLIETFRKADEILLNAVRGISDLITHTGIINVDFADVRTVMANRGMALMGTGICTGPDRAIKAATQAINSPLLEDLSIDGATGIIINIAGNQSLTTHETNEAVTLIMEAADEEAEIIFGTVIDEEMKDEIKITVIATGLGDHRKAKGLESSSSLKNEIREIKEVKEVKEIKQEAVSNEIKVEPKIEIKSDRHDFQLRDNSLTSQTLSLQNEDEITQIVKEASLQYQPKESKLTFERNSGDYQIPKSEIKEKIDQKDLERSKNEVRAKTIAERLGFINFDEDEFDSPSFLRKDPNAKSDLRERHL